MRARLNGLDRVATDLIQIDQEQPSPDAIERASHVIRRGGLVAIPTDALYVLVADPFNLAAIGKVFLAKGRETHRSLPILVSDALQAEDLTTEMTGRFTMLARRFWPGPLTIIVPASARLPLRVTGNTGRLALRQSRSKVVAQLLEHLNMPLVGTSANISGSPTCKEGIDVFGSMDGRVDLVLDGGACFGEGATTVDITEAWWKIIKHGAIDEKEIAEVLKGR
jgi:L-threonylcarbamoyladenylate synthase